MVRPLPNLMLLILGCGTLCVQTAFASADPFRSQWREQRVLVREILQRLNVETMSPTTPVEVTKYLSAASSPDKTSKFTQIRAELDPVLRFTEPSDDNPEAHNPDLSCAYTGPEGKSPIQLSKVDCGAVSDFQKKQTLIEAAISHFQDADEELAGSTALAIVESFNWGLARNPRIALLDRYVEIEPSGTAATLLIDLNSGKPAKLTGDVEINLLGLGKLRVSSGGEFEANGVYSRMECVNANGTRQEIKLEAEIHIAPRSNGHLIGVHGWYFEIRSHCDLEMKRFGYEMKSQSAGG